MSRSFESLTKIEVLYIQKEIMLLILTLAAILNCVAGDGKLSVLIDMI